MRLSSARDPRAGDHPHPSPIVQLEGITRTFPGVVPVHALRATNLVVESGEFLTISGPSGSGKSTLLSILGLLDSPTEGHYFLSGNDVSTLDDKVKSGLRGSGIGFVFQAFHLIAGRTTVDNVAVGMLYRRTPRSERYRQALEALETVRLAHLAESMPAVLSGGERQRVAIARAIAGQPQILLCDEPTGNLDSASAEQVMEALGELHDRGLTIIVVSHNPAVVARGQRRLKMIDGVLSEDPRVDA